MPLTSQMTHTKSPCPVSLPRCCPGPVLWLQPAHSSANNACATLHSDDSLEVFHLFSSGLWLVQHVSICVWKKVRAIQKMCMCMHVHVCIYSCLANLWKTVQENASSSCLRGRKLGDWVGKIGIYFCCIYLVSLWILYYIYMHYLFKEF